MIAQETEIVILLLVDVLVRDFLLAEIAAKKNVQMIAQVMENVIPPLVNVLARLVIQVLFAKKCNALKTVMVKDNVTQPLVNALVIYHIMDLTAEKKCMIALINVQIMVNVMEKLVCVLAMKDSMEKIVQEIQLQLNVLETVLMEEYVKMENVHVT
jgi:hypothetical protein